MVFKRIIPDLHKAAFAGVEYKLDAGDEPANPKQLMWRTVSSFLENRSSNGPAFSGNEDDTLVNVANRLAQKYLAKALELEFEIWTLEVENPFLPCEGIDWVLFPVNCAVLDGYYRKRVEKRNINRDAYNWLNTADITWKTIIGAMEFQPDSMGSCQCISADGDWSVVTHTNLPTNESDCLALNNDPMGNMDCIFVPLQVPVFKPSDGVVTLESASGFPGVNKTNRVEETNHFQLRNSVGTRDALMLLYGGLAGDDWFYTE